VCYLKYKTYKLG